MKRKSTDDVSGRMSSGRNRGLTRRRFLAATAVAGVASTLPLDFLSAHSPATYRRRNLSDLDPSSPVLNSYKRAIEAMLALPPDDPRNWYRQALTHTLDCPHGNWWFVNWHRGYLGWFERICRELSGDPDFAMPFWDWTAKWLPDAFLEGILNPADPRYLSSFEIFESEFRQPMGDFYESLSGDQNRKLAERKRPDVSTPKKLFARCRGMFMDPPRGAWTDPGTAISLETIECALYPRDFLGFGSGKSDCHSLRATKEEGGEGVLESQPHDNVHGDVGGFMTAFLSPVDPLFFTHHSNIDRLWDIWTRKQMAHRWQPLPQDPGDLLAWRAEEYLFFVDEAGNPVAQKNTARDYEVIGDFAYSYDAGSAEDVATRPRLAAAFPPRQFQGAMRAATLAAAQPGLAQIDLPDDLLADATREDGTSVVAEVTIDPPDDVSGLRFHVLVNVPEGTNTTDVDSPHHAGTIAFFGHHQGPATFQVPICPALLRELRAEGMLQDDDPIDIHVVPETRGISLRSRESTLVSVSLRTF